MSISAAPPPRVCFLLDALRPTERDAMLRCQITGAEVHLLWCADPPISPEPPPGVQVHVLADYRLPTWRDLPTSAFIRLTDNILHAVRCLEHDFEYMAAIFPERGGLAFRVVQSRRQRTGFAAMRLIALGIGPTFVVSDTSNLLDPADSLRRYHAERYSFENADSRFVVDDGMRQQLGRLGWNGASEGPFDAAVALAPLPTSTDAGERPLVSVVVTHHNLGAFLPDVLASIARQDYAPLDVIVIDDGSTDVQSQAVFKGQSDLYPDYRFVVQENRGACAARNHGIALARGDYVVHMDADNVAMPFMISRMVRAALGRPDVAALTCFYLAFERPEDIVSQRFKFGFQPLGGPLVMACFENSLGDTNAIYRKADLLAVGGFDEHQPELGFQDLDLLVRLALAGKKLDVIPEYLFYYRCRADGISRATNTLRNQQRVIERLTAVEHWPFAERWLLWRALAAYGTNWQTVAPLLHRLPALATFERTLTFALGSQVGALVARLPRGGVAERIVFKVNAAMRRLAARTGFLPEQPS